MPNYEYRVYVEGTRGKVSLYDSGRRLCAPVNGQNLRFTDGPKDFWLRVIGIEPRTGMDTIIYLRAETTSYEQLRAAGWKEESG